MFVYALHITKREIMRHLSVSRLSTLDVTSLRYSRSWRTIKAQKQRKGYHGVPPPSGAPWYKRRSSNEHRSLFCTEAPSWRHYTKWISAPTYHLKFSETSLNI